MILSFVFYFEHGHAYLVFTFSFCVVFFPSCFCFYFGFCCFYFFYFRFVFCCVHFWFESGLFGIKRKKEGLQFQKKLASPCGLMVSRGRMHHWVANYEGEEGLCSFDLCFFMFKFLDGTLIYIALFIMFCFVLVCRSGATRLIIRCNRCGNCRCYGISGLEVGF